MLAFDAPDNNVPNPVWLGWFGVQGDGNGTFSGAPYIYHSLIKFTDISIPQGVTILSAKLKLGTSIWAGGAASVDVTTQSLLKSYNTGTGANGPADPGEVTWNSRAHNQELWEVAGANGTTDAAPVVDPITTWVPYTAQSNYDLTASLQQQADSGNFYGWVMKPVQTSGTALAIYSNGAPTAAPVLNVEYVDPNELLLIAVDPNPQDDEPNLPRSQILQWWVAAGAPGSGDPAQAINEVYIGTDPDLSGVTPVNIGTANSYDPDLEFSTPYYWRVDLTDPVSSTTYTGTVWTFTTIAPEPYGPDPVDDAEGVALNAVLSWQSADEAFTHYLYINEASVDPDLTSTTPIIIDSATSYDPDNLQLSTEYHWRIIDHEGEDTYEGPIWSFTTTDVLECDPLSSDLNDDCLIDLRDFAVISGDWMDFPDPCSP